MNPTLEHPPGPSGTIDASELEGPDARAILDALRRIEDRLDRVEALAVKASADAKGGLAIIGDTFDGLMGRMQAAGIDPDERLRNLLAAADKLSSTRVLALLDAALSRADAIRMVLESGILDPHAVAVMSKAGSALADAAAHPHGPVGVFGLLRAMSSRELQWASGFLVGFAETLGRAIRTGAARQLPAAATDGEVFR